MGRPPKERIENDAEVTPQYKHQVKIAKEDEEIKQQHSVTEEYFIQNGDKVLKCFKKANGNVVRMYAFKASKHPKVLSELKKSGQFKLEG